MTTVPQAPTVRRRFGAVGLVLLLTVVVAFAWAGSPTHSGLPPVGGLHPAIATAAHSPPASAHPASGGPAASGRGVFFDTQLVPNASSAAVTCYGTTCVNVSNDPALNWTSTGAIALAYTAYTNASPCVAAVPYAQSEIGFIVSTNGGTSWSLPSYLGAPSSCSTAVAQAEPDAWQPSLTSLGNGTLVLVYVAFNSTGPIAPVALGPTAYSVTTDRLLLTESYNNGTTWTTPTTLNVSDNLPLGNTAFTAERPSATATGATVYVAWMNVTESVGFASGGPTGSEAVQLLTSTNNGTSWPSSPTTLPVVSTPGGPYVAMNPNAIVLPSGQLSIAYATNVTYHATYGCQGSTCLSGGWESDVVVASSTNNGTSFSIATAGSGVLIAPSRYVEAFLDPSPQLAYGGPSGAMAITFAGGDVLTICIAGTCGPVRDSEVVFVGNSSTSGASWTPAHVVMPGLWGYGVFGTFYMSFAYNPAVTVDRNGTFDLVFTYDNYSICQLTIFGGNFCGPQQEEFAQSGDNGSSFVGPVLVSRDWTQLYNNPSMPDGEYASIVAAGGQLWLAWTLDACPAWTTGLYGPFPTSYCYSEIGLSQLDASVGVTLTFTESGLTNGIIWNVSVMGNARAVAAPGSLSVSGVPVGTLVDWGFNPSIEPLYGERFSGSSTSTPPSSYTTSTTIAVVYVSQVLVSVTTVPGFPVAQAPYAPYCFTGYPATGWNDPTCATMTYNVTVVPPAPSPAQGPGAVWVAPGSSVVLNATPIGAYYCTVGVNCYDNDVLNLSFQSWTGTGSGSVNTTSNLTTVVANGPINETANFLLSGYCYVTYYSSPASPTCIQDNTTLTFHETGLPNGTAWDVSVASAFGNATAGNTTPWIPVQGAPTIGPATFQVWTVPGTGGYWVPSTSPLSPVQLPVTGVVNVNFTFDSSLAGLSFPLDVGTSGLPSGVTWSYSLNSSSYGVSAGNGTVTTAPAGTYSVTGSAVEDNNGSEYAVTGVDVRSLVVNQSGWSNTTAPGSVKVHGPAEVILVYTPKYWLDVEATSGGAAGPASAWYGSGAAVTLSETATTGFHFTSWTGTGNGAATTVTTAPTIHVFGPVTELANFVENASLEDQITVSEVGLPAGVGFSFAVDARGFTANGSVTVSGFVDGPYRFLAQNVTDLPTGELGMVTGSVSSYLTNPNGTLQVVGDGTVQVNYTVQDQLTTGIVGQGTITPPSEWVGTGLVVTVTTSPASGWQFDDLATLLPYIALSTPGTFQVQVTAPGTVVAQFTAIPAGPTPVYNLTVTASGLPAGVDWNVSVGPTGASGTTGTLTVLGLSAGQYMITAPTIYVGAGTRYVPTNSAPLSVAVPTVLTATVTFAVQYEVTIGSSAGGTAGPASEWVAAGTVVSLTEGANSTDVFVNWTGTGTGAYSGTTGTSSVTVNGPVTEFATFGPAPVTVTAPATTSGSSFPTLGVALLVVLLVVGAVAGLLLGRRSGGRSPPAEPESAPPSEEAPPETLYGETPAEATPDGDGTEAPP